MPAKKHLPEHEIVRLYTTRLSDGTWTGAKTIGRLFKTSDTNVLAILHRHGVQTRTSKEAFSGGKRTKPITRLPKKGDTPPPCRCGCGESVEWNQRKNKWNVFVSLRHHHPSFLDDREWLYTQYTIKGKTLQQIANELHTNSTTVRRHLAKFEITIRTQGESLALSGAVKKEKNPQWKGGIAKWSYAPEWQSIARKIKYRDHWTCQKCGEKRSKWGSKLHVHHIDQNKFNNDFSNLISLCSHCHGQSHKKANG